MWRSPRHKFLDRSDHRRWGLGKDVGEIEQGGERWAFFTALKLPDIVPVVSGMMGQLLLRISTAFPKLPKNHTKRRFGIESSSLPAGFSRHDSDCRVSTTTVLPTYSSLPGVRACTRQSCARQYDPHSGYYDSTTQGRLQGKHDSPYTCAEHEVKMYVKSYNCQNDTEVWACPTPGCTHIRIVRIAA